MVLYVWEIIILYIYNKNSNYSEQQVQSMNQCRKPGF